MIKILFSFLFAVVFFLFLAIFGIAMLVRSFLKTKPNKIRIKEDLQILKKKVKDQLLIDLSPWENNELELLSLEQINKKIQRSNAGTFGQGIISSIYHEPLIAYAYKKYGGSKHNALLFAKSSEHEYVYRITSKGTFITMDGKELGELRENGVIYNPENRMIGRINKNQNELLLPIMVKGREIASLINPKLNKNDTVPRALDLVSKSVTDEEEAIFVALAAFELAYNNEQDNSFY